jgi:hypothetical protein
MLNSYKTSTTEVILKNGKPIDWLAITPKKDYNTQRVLQEFMVNMKNIAKLVLL